jgi:hypothetical protein
MMFISMNIGYVATTGSVAIAITGSAATFHL